MDGIEIVGADGRVMSPEDGQALLLISGYESGTLAPEIVGSAIPMLLGSGRVSTPVRSRLTNLQGLLSRPLGFNFNQAVRNTQQGPHVAPAPYGTIREVVQGLAVASIAAGASQVVQFNASMAFKPTRFMLGPTLAPFFTIDDIRIAADSLFLSAGAVPGEAFLPDAVTASALRRRTAQPGTVVAITVTNIDGAAHPFRGAIFGEAVDTSSCPT